MKLLWWALCTCGGALSGIISHAFESSDTVIAPSNPTLNEMSSIASSSIHSGAVMDYITDLLPVPDILSFRATAKANRDVMNIAFLPAYVTAAINIGDVEMLQRCMKVHSLTHVMTTDGRELIVFAAQKGNVDIIQELLTAESIESSVKSAMFQAITHGNFQIVNLIMQKVNMKFTVVFEWALHLSCANGEYQTVDWLLKHTEVDPSIDENRAFFVALANKSFQVVRRLMDDSRVDPSDRDDLGIQFASRNGLAEFVDLMLRDPRVSPEANENAAIIMASIGGYLDVVNRLLLDQRVDPSADDNRALKSALRNWNGKLVKRLMLDHRVWRKWFYV